MIKIIPAIIAKDFKELKEKIKLVEPYVDWTQLDIMDGKFVDNTTWNNPSELSGFQTQAKLEAHLMIEKPEEHIDKWIKSGVSRIIFHYEATDKHQEVFKKIQNADLEAGLAINPKTSISVLDDLLQIPSYKSQVTVLIMTVEPGRGGQEFLEETLGKIKNLRDKYKNVKIGADGGINLETAPKIIEAGADFLSIGSAIFKGDVEENIKNLKEL